MFIWSIIQLLNSIYRNMTGGQTDFMPLIRNVTYGQNCSNVGVFDIEWWKWEKKFPSRANFETKSISFFYFLFVLSLHFLKTVKKDSWRKSTFSCIMIFLKTGPIFILYFSVKKFVLDKHDIYKYNNRDVQAHSHSHSHALFKCSQLQSKPEFYRLFKMDQLDCRGEMLSIMYIFWYISNHWYLRGCKSHCPVAGSLFTSCSFIDVP